MFSDLLKWRGNIGTLARTVAWFALDQRKRISNGFSSSDTFLTKMFVPVFPRGKRFLSRLRTVRIVFCRSKEIAGAMFNDSTLYDAAEGYRPLQSVLGVNSVFVQNGDAHARARVDIRKILNHLESEAKGPFAIENYVKSHLKTGQVQFFELAQQITSEYLFDNMFARADKRTRDTYRQRCLRISREVTGTAVVLLGPSRTLDKPPLRSLFKKIRRIRSERLDLRSFIGIYIRENRGAISEILGRPIGDDDVPPLIDNYLTFVVAGFESTATSVAWTAYELARDPDLQDRLRSDINAEKTDFLKRFVLESLRLHPPIPFFVRRIMDDHVLPNGERVRRGDIVIFAIEEANRRIVDGESFIPSRDGRPMQSFTFGGGARVCPGKGLALKEIQIIISTIIKHYRLTLNPSAPPEAKMNNSVTATPKNGMRMMIEPVEVRAG